MENILEKTFSELEPGDKVYSWRWTRTGIQAEKTEYTVTSTDFDNDTYQFMLYQGTHRYYLNLRRGPRELSHYHSGCMVFSVTPHLPVGSERLIGDLVIGDSVWFLDLGTGVIRETRVRTITRDDHGLGVRLKSGNHFKFYDMNSDTVAYLNFIFSVSRESLESWIVKVLENQGHYHSGITDKYILELTRVYSKLIRRGK